MKRLSTLEINDTILFFVRLDALEKSPKEPYVHVTGSKSFSVSHYSGTVSYQLKDVLAKNRDFLAPEVVETMRMSKDVIIKDLFANRLTKSGNLTVCRDKALMIKTKNSRINRWGAALMAEKTPIRVRRRRKPISN